MTEIWQVIDERMRKNKGGRPPKFKKPQELWDAAVEYFKWADANPIEVSTKVAKGTKKKGKAKETNDKKASTSSKTPYSLHSFQAHAGIADWCAFKQSQCYQSDGFLVVIRAIENVIAGKQIDGAIAGVYQANIVARLNGIADKKDITSDGERISGDTTVIGWPDVLKESDKVKEDELYE